MIKLDCMAGKKIALFGLGESGIATAKALINGGATVISWDDNENSRLKAAKEHIMLNKLDEINWQEISSLVLSPGVPLYLPEPHWSVKLATQHNVEIIGDIELFIRQRNFICQKRGDKIFDYPFFAITGTNGKSTTTSLVAHLLKKIGKKVQIGGNIGIPILALDDFSKGNFYVIECSSFQIDLTPSLNPDIGILLNITPDHIDRHGSFEKYAEVKARLIEGSKIGLVPDGFESSAKNIVHVAVDKELKVGYFSRGTSLYQAKEGQEKQLADLKDTKSLRGKHNMQDALNAVGAIMEFLSPAELDGFNWQQALLEYKNLPHRMEEVRQIGGILFINDSKATNSEASQPALEAFDNIYWIIGGIAKQGGINSLKPFFHKINRAYLIGEAAEDFAKTIKNSFQFTSCETLEKATRQAFADAKEAVDGKRAVILLSPACSSYDQFANYSARGDCFKNIVNSL